MNCFRKSVNFFIGKMNVKNWHICGLLLTISCCLGLALLVFGQILLGGDWKLSRGLQKNWYGEVYQVQTASKNDTEIWGNLVLELVDYTELPDLIVLVNGQPVQKFTQKQVTVRVIRGDLVSVDGSDYEKPITVRVKSVSSVIDSQTLQELTTVKQNSAEIGTVFLK